MHSDARIWVLGAINPNADRNIPWEAREIPNLSDPDILIINLGSLNGGLLRALDRDKCRTVVTEISEKFLNGGTIIYITGPKVFEKTNSTSETRYKSKVRILSPGFSNYSFSITDVEPNDVAEGSVIKYDNQKHFFSSYLDKVKKFHFYLSYSVEKSEHLVNFRTESNTVKLTVLKEYSLKDNSSHDLALAMQIQTDDRTKRGNIIYLPLPTAVSVEEGINIILERYGKFSLHEVFPEWISQVDLYGLDSLNRKLTKLHAGKMTIEEKINKLERSKSDLMNYYKLLFSHGTSLENSVRDAFKVLGFEEIRKIRENNTEDWIFEFKSLDDFIYAVLEVKGSGERTTQGDISQCDKWVSEYFGYRNEHVKGIFIPNQYRLKSYPASRNDRLHFEANELKFSALRSICIIPSCILFEAVNRALKKRPRREDLENLIACHKGLLTEIGSPTS